MLVSTLPLATLKDLAVTIGCTIWMVFWRNIHEKKFLLTNFWNVLQALKMLHWLDSTFTASTGQRLHSQRSAKLQRLKMRRNICLLLLISLLAFLSLQPSWVILVSIYEKLSIIKSSSVNLKFNFLSQVQWYQTWMWHVSNFKIEWMVWSSIWHFAKLAVNWKHE